MRRALLEDASCEMDRLWNWTPFRRRAATRVVMVVANLEAGQLKQGSELDPSHASANGNGNSCVELIKVNIQTRICTSKL
jgi:hypothetical protein